MKRFYPTLLIAALLISLLCLSNPKLWPKFLQEQKAHSQRQMLGQWLTLHSPSDYSLLININNTSYHEGFHDLKTLDTYYQRISEYAPNLSEPYFIRGFIQYHQGHNPEAIRLWQETLNRNPGNFLAYYNIAYLLIASNQPEMAQHILVQALQINPADVLRSMATSKVYQDILRGHQLDSHLEFAYKQSQAFIDNPSTHLGPVIFF